MKNAKRLIIQILIILGLVGVFFLVFFLLRLKKTPAPQTIITPVRITKSEYGSLEKKLVLTGFISSQEMATITPKVQGTLTELLVDLGDSVSAGQIVARIDSEPYRLELAQAQAAFQATDSTWKRVSALYDSGSVTKQIYDQAKAQYDASKSQYEMAQLQMRYTGVTASISGSVMIIHARAGNSVSLTTPLITIGDLSEMKVVLTVPEQYYTEIMTLTSTAENPAVNIQIPALNNYQGSGFIKAVAPYISPQSRTFELVCILDTNDKKNIRPGMFARVTVILNREDTIYTLPYSALTGGNSLWIAENGIARQLPYTPLFEGENKFRIPDEYAGYDFIIEGQHFLKNNNPVHIMD